MSEETDPLAAVTGGVENERTALAHHSPGDLAEVDTRLEPGSSGYSSNGRRQAGQISPERPGEPADGDEESQPLVGEGLSRARSAGKCDDDVPGSPGTQRLMTSATSKSQELLRQSSKGSADGRYGECRICQEEDVVENLDTPCTCAGSVRYAHSECLQKWCNEKGNTTCEICHQPYKDTYTAPPPRHDASGSSNVVSIEIRERAGPDGTPSRVLTLRDSVTGEETRFDLSEPEEEHSNALSCCKAFLLALTFFLLLRLAITIIGDPAEDDDSFVLLVLLRDLGVLLPLFIMARAIAEGTERMREQETVDSEAAEAAAQVAFLLHARHAHLTSQPSTFAAASGPPARAALPPSAPPVAQGVV